MALHRARINDCDQIPAEKMSLLQQIAARTAGLLTLPNLITMLGGSFVIYSLFQLHGDISHENIISATIFIIFGRLLDIADGYAAEWTKTKSPFGEALDESVDKIALFLVAIVLLVKQLVPSWVLYVMLAHGLFNVILTIIALLRKRRFYPSFLGKLAVWFEWVAITAFLGLILIDSTSFWHIILKITAWVSFACFAGLGFYSSIKYSRNKIFHARRINPYYTRRGNC